MDVLNPSAIEENNVTENDTFSEITRLQFYENSSLVPLWIVICNILVLAVSACVNFIFILVLLCSRRNGKIF